MRDVREICVPRTASLRNVVQVIDRGASQIALVVDDDGKLVGTATDGDVRRGLLRGEGLDAPVERIMCREYRFLSSTASEADALALMRAETIFQVPVLDERGQVVRLYLLEDLIKQKVLENPVVVMAGGEGRRLLPLTAECPKPMLRVGGKPILERVLEHSISAGLGRFYFAVNYLKEQIKDHFGDGTHWGVRIEYIEESMPMGTAGALALLPDMPEHPVLVMNGDVLTRVDFASLLRFHAEHDAIATVCVREHATQIPYGVVRIGSKGVEELEEKPLLTHYVNAGIYVLEPSLFRSLHRDRALNMPDLLRDAMSQGGRVSAFPIHEYWLDVGLPETLELAHQDWR